jgi:NAD(P)H-hydrate repair Nnr-like enzyme with NAD(P)H-hydrate epimerase domain
VRGRPCGLVVAEEGGNGGDGVAAQQRARSFAKAAERFSPDIIDIR